MPLYVLILGLSSRGQLDQRELGCMSRHIFPWAKGNACVSRQIIPAPWESLAFKVNDMEKVFPGSAQAEEAVGFWFETPMAYGTWQHVLVNATTY